MPEYKLAAPVIRADLKRCRIESRVVLDLDTGDVVMHYGRCAVGDDPTESKRASFKLSALTLAALDLRNEGIAAGDVAV